MPISEGHLCLVAITENALDGLLMLQRTGDGGSALAYSVLIEVSVNQLELGFYWPHFGSQGS